MAGFLKVSLILLFLTIPTWSYMCQQCSPSRIVQINGGRKFKFNFEQFFNGNPRFKSFGSPNQRVFNIYGQDAEAFGSAIGKSIAQRIRQAYSQMEPTATVPASQTSPTSAPTSPTQTFAQPSTYPATHPPEDLPTVRDAYQQALSTPSVIMSSRGNTGFEGVPGMLPATASDCPWCSGALLRSKRDGEKF